MVGITVSAGDLHGILKPIIAQLDLCWWYLGGAGVSLNSLVVPDAATLGPPPYSPERLAACAAAYQKAADEYALWVDGDLASFRIGIPGFFSRFGNVIDADWNCYFASDSERAPVKSFGQVEALQIDCFEPLPELPPDICLYARIIDGVYWDLFFRDEPSSKLVWEHLRNARYTASPFAPPPDQLRIT